MDERYKELLIKFYEKIEATYQKIAFQFYHYFGKDKVDLQYNREKKEFNIESIPYVPVGAIFPGLLDRDISQGNFDTLSDDNKKIVTDVLENLVNDTESMEQGRMLADSMKIAEAKILVYFPEVRVTNENDKFIDIQDLYVQVSLNYRGEMESGFKMNRTTYTFKQIVSDYLHSHVHGIGNNISELREFKNPCLGSGPIRDTSYRLMSRSCAELDWLLFCTELDKYVHTESTAGIPYKYLERVGGRSTDSDCEIERVHTAFCYTTHVFKTFHARRFTEYLIDSKKLSFNFINGSYSLGMSMLQYMIMVSNLFIEWYNQCVKDSIRVPSKGLLFTKGIVMRTTIINGRVYKENGDNSIDAFLTYVGQSILTFKGKSIPFKIIDFGKDDHKNEFLMLKPVIAISILNVILKVLNYRYGKETAVGGTANGGDSYCSDIKTDVTYI